MEILPNHTFVPFGPYLAQMEVDPKYCAKVLKLGKTPVQVARTLSSYSNSDDKGIGETLG